LEKETDSPILTYLMVVILGVLFLHSCRESGREKNGDGKSVIKDSIPAFKSAAEGLPDYLVEGEKVYRQHCLVCHQAGGGGVPGLNPPLKGTSYVTGDTNTLLSIVINGSNEGLVVHGSTYSNAMPAFKALSDKDIAQVTSYIRQSFGNSAEPITALEVSAFRSKTP